MGRNRVVNSASFQGCAPAPSVLAILGALKPLCWDLPSTWIQGGPEPPLRSPPAWGGESLGTDHTPMKLVVNPSVNLGFLFSSPSKFTLSSRPMSLTSEIHLSSLLPCLFCQDEHPSCHHFSRLLKATHLVSFTHTCLSPYIPHTSRCDCLQK